MAGWARCSGAGGPQTARPAVRTSIAAGSIPVIERPEEGAPLVTELIVGERAVVLEERGGWLRVVVPGHATALDPRGYRGWTRPDGPVAAPDRDPRLMVVATNGAGLTLGALLGKDRERRASPGVIRWALRGAAGPPRAVRRRGGDRGVRGLHWPDV